MDIFGKKSPNTRLFWKKFPIFVVSNYFDGKKSSHTVI